MEPCNCWIRADGAVLMVPDHHHFRYVDDSWEATYRKGWIRVSKPEQSRNAWGIAASHPTARAAKTMLQMFRSIEQDGGQVDAAFPCRRLHAAPYSASGFRDIRNSIRDLAAENANK